MTRAQSSAAKRGVSDTSPWQFALCPSRLAVCVPPQAPALPSLFQSKGQNLQRRKFPSWQKNPNQPPHHPEKRAGRSPRRKTALPSRRWREASVRQIRVRVRNAAVVSPAVWITRGESTEGGGLCAVPSAFANGSLISFFRAALFRGTQGGCHFLFQGFCAHTMWMPLVLLPLSMGRMIHVLCALSAVRFLNLLL